GFDALREAASRITAHYRRHGYVLALADPGRRMTPKLEPTMPNEICRNAALAAVRAALADALARDFDNALPIHRYVDALQGWTAKPGHCHEQVERWVQSHPGDTPVRGWVNHADFGVSIQFVSHSLVRTAAGELLDVTYAAPGYRQHFIEHPAAAGDFFALVLGEPPVPTLDVPYPDRS
ncbi:hypothetical protein G3N57_35070, partial [Paraburkholderia sp. Se-20369]|nr:hypothetical protein [Paraburkholderia sp. Se-20369]